MAKGLAHDKYVVFKVEEWDAFIGFLNLQYSAILPRLPDAVPDAEVFRHQDLATAPVLYTAASVYRSLQEVADGHITPLQQRYLASVADHFFEAAEKASGLPGRKLPD